MYGTLIFSLHKFSVQTSKVNLTVLDNVGGKSCLLSFSWFKGDFFPFSLPEWQHCKMTYLSFIVQLPGDRRYRQRMEHACPAYAFFPPFFLWNNKRIHAAGICIYPIVHHFSYTLELRWVSSRDKFTRLQ